MILCFRRGRFGPAPQVVCNALPAGAGVSSAAYGLGQQSHEV